MKRQLNPTASAPSPVLSPVFVETLVRTDPPGSASILVFPATITSVTFPAPGEAASGTAGERPDKG